LQVASTRCALTSSASYSRPSGGLEVLILPEQNPSDAASLGGCITYGVRSLRDAVDLLAGGENTTLAAASNGRGVTETPVDQFFRRCC